MGTYYIIDSSVAPIGTHTITISTVGPPAFSPACYQTINVDITIGSSTCEDLCESTTLEDKTLVDQTVYLDNGSAHIYNVGVFTDTEGQSQGNDNYCG